jgi:hypothetical protein
MTGGYWFQGMDVLSTLPRILPRNSK